jgi:hypothetical protein
MALRPTEDIHAGVFMVKLKSAAAEIILCLMSGTVVLAQDGHDQTPPSDQQAPADKPAEKPKCVTSNTAWREKGKSTLFEIELQNTCDQRLKCTVDAFVIGSRGQAHGHGTLILAPAAKGQPTRNVYALKVKSAGGMANVSHSCKTI